MLPFLLQMLRPEGILVGPFDGSLIKVVKVGSHDCADMKAQHNRHKKLSHRRREFTNDDSSDYDITNLMSVAYAPLCPAPTKPPAGKDPFVHFKKRVWSPDTHSRFPSISVWL